MPNLSLLASDITLEKDGRWVDDPWGAGFRFKLSRFGKKEFKDRVNDLRQDYLEELREGEEVPPAEAVRIVCDAFCHKILKDWNVTDDDGNPIPYTPERGIETLSDPRYEEVYDFLFKESSDKLAYAQRVQEAGLKN